MRKSGLQKKIASIFDDVPVPPGDSASMPLPVPQQASEQEPPVAVSTQQKTEAQSRAVNTAAVSTLRPRPLPKIQVKTPKEKTTKKITDQIKQLVYGSKKGQINARQKKMTIVVGALSLVFAVVLFSTLGGAGQSKVKAADNAPTGQETENQANQQHSIQWQPPQPLPAEMRNPMAPGVSRSVQDQSSPGQGQLVVRGIVFSKDNPSAIINGQIVKLGEDFYGVKIVDITKETVEFEKDGERWTQPVQR